MPHIFSEALVPATSGVAVKKNFITAKICPIPPPSLGGVGHHLGGMGHPYTFVQMSSANIISRKINIKLKAGLQTLCAPNSFWCRQLHHDICYWYGPHIFMRRKVKTGALFLLSQELDTDVNIIIALDYPCNRCQIFFYQT